MHQEARLLEQQTTFSARDVAKAAELSRRYLEILEEMELMPIVVPPAANLDGIAELMK